VTREHDHDPELGDVASRLEAERPIPDAAFRGRLRRRLFGRPDDGWRSAPARLRRQIVAYAGSGAALLAVAVIGVAGAGPFAT
jgi:hypothetical protein